tara:strand:- start:871 stop:1164 length:294 start_codon:yes stop_codon:yes gene_type:complete
MAIMKIVSILINGRVQGVGFRAFVLGCASSSRLIGWVKNLRDGRVKIVAGGSEHDLDVFLATVKSGPPGSIINHIIVDEVQYDERLNNGLQSFVVVW